MRHPLDMRDASPRCLTARAMWGRVPRAGYVYEWPSLRRLVLCECGFSPGRGRETCATLWPKCFAWVRRRDLAGFLKAKHMNFA